MARTCNNAAKKQQPGFLDTQSRDCHDAYRGKRASHIIRSLPGTEGALQGFRRNGECE